MDKYDVPRIAFINKMDRAGSDFHAAILQRRPGNSWDGTLISKDGVHPSGGKSQDYSKENLKACGYALRNWVNFLILREVYFRVLHPEKAR